jgi:hypothetical protein
MQCLVCGATLSGQATCLDCGTEVASMGTPVGSTLMTAVPPPPLEEPAAPVPAVVPGCVVAELGSSASVVASLTVKRGGALTTQRFEIAGTRVVLGRFDTDSGPVDIDFDALPEAHHVSRHHCELWCDGGRWFVQDLKSANGTFVRAAASAQFARVGEGAHHLQDGDELALGNARFVFALQGHG